MKLMSWVLSTSLILPHVPVHAASGNSLSIDTKTLYQNHATNSIMANQSLMTTKRQSFAKDHPKLGNVRDQLFTDMSKDHNMLNLQTGMTFWEEFQALQNGDRKVITDKYPGELFVKLAARVKPDLLHFITWLNANGLAALKSVLHNAPNGILELESLRIKNNPYKADGPTYVITKYKDVVQALSNPELFSVRNYHQRMKDSVGDFMLGNDKKAVNHEHTWARKMIDMAEMESRVRPLIRSIFQQEMKNLEYIKKNPSTGQLEGNIELVNQIARRIPAILTIKYFGFEGFTPEKIMEWSRATQDDFFHNIPNDQNKAAAAVKAGQEMQIQLVSLVDRKFSQIESLARLSPAQRTVLDRMVLSIGEINESMTPDELIEKASDKLYLKKSDDENIETLSSKELVSRIKSRIRTNLIGTLVGGIETTQAAIVQPLNLLLSNKELLAQAKNLAIQARSSGQAQQTFNNFIWEVLRFHPVNNVVFRVVEKDTELSGVKLKGKSHVMIATQAAMFDPEAFPNPESIVLDRFASLREEKYFHLGYGHHRCLGDYVSMVQVPEIIAGILALPNVRKMPGEFGELDFNKMTKRNLIGGDEFDRSFPERMIIEYDSSEARPLTMKPIEVPDYNTPFEAYLRDYDRIHFRGCLSGWNIVQDQNGQLLYSPSSSTKPIYYPRDPRYITQTSEFSSHPEMLKTVKSITDNKIKNGTALAGTFIRGSQEFAMNLREGNNDLLYCRLPIKFHICFESESEKVKKVLGIAQISQDAKSGDSLVHAPVKAIAGNKAVEIRNQTEKADPRLAEAHRHIFSTCASFAKLTETEKAFYENRYFGKPVDLAKLDTRQSQRPAMWDKDFGHEDYFSAQPRYYYRGSYINPAGWGGMEEPGKIDFYVRLNFKYRMCFGGKLLKRVPRCEGYNACVNGTYNTKTFKYEGALSPMERKVYNELIFADGPCEK
ncbi:MAG: cytochrome P450 [Bdellovibrionaceae bacterium]|nr:cytochrome P450 [Pseudobdellovibrionaceae bacterium]